MGFEGGCVTGLEEVLAVTEGASFVTDWLHINLPLI